KYSVEQVPHKNAIYQLVKKKLRTEGIFIDIKPIRVKRVSTEEKLDDVAYFLQNSPSKYLRHLSQQAGISKTSARKAMKLLKFKKFLKTCSE
ncbi:hypothetical protein C0J52_22999, partial [Blattella germanica]